MDEQNKTGEQQNWCGCPMCKRWSGTHGCCSWQWRKCLLRTLFTVFAMLIVFLIGVKVGEFKSEYRQNKIFFRGGPMMQPTQDIFYYQR
jgi:hypothetical protein